MSASFLPLTDSGLLTWSQNFNARISVQPSPYNLTLEQSTAYEVAYTDYASAYQLAKDPITRTSGTVAAKNTAKDVLIELSRDLAKVCDGQPSLTDQQRVDLGLKVRKTPAPIPAPTTAPDIDIVSIVGRTINLRLHDADTQGRRKPDGVKGATVLSYVGDTPPTDISAWKFEGNTTRTTIDVTFGNEYESGTKVWMTAFWTNPRLQSGPAADPISTFLQYGLSQAA